MSQSILKGFNLGRKAYSLVIKCVIQNWMTDVLQYITAAWSKQVNKKPVAGVAVLVLILSATDAENRSAERSYMEQMAVSCSQNKMELKAD